MNLNAYSRKVFSQSGEDGILEKLFQVLNIQNGWCCEFGAGDGCNISNTYKLRQEGWSSVLIEGDKQYEPHLKSLENTNTHVVSAFISCEQGERLDDLLRKTPIPSDFDLLSIDIDGNDLWVWRSLHEYTPKVVIIEYNNCYPASSSLTIHYNRNHRFQNNDYYGATVGALYKLASKKGYKLVGFTPNLNLVFVRNDLASPFLEFRPTDVPALRGHPPSPYKLIPYEE
jgi:hypothetical protein